MSKTISMPECMYRCTVYVYASNGYPLLQSPPVRSRFSSGFQPLAAPAAKHQPLL